MRIVFCEHLDKVAQEDHTYVATLEERRRYEKVWKLCLNIQGPVGTIKSRSDYPETVRRIREIKREVVEAGYEINLQLVVACKSDKGQDNNSSIQGNLMRGQTPQLVGFDGSLANHLLHFPHATFSRVWVKALNWAQHALFSCVSFKSHLHPHGSCAVIVA